jgi:hypothetical protein
MDNLNIAPPPYVVRDNPSPTMNGQASWFIDTADGSHEGVAEVYVSREFAEGLVDCINKYFDSHKEPKKDGRDSFKARNETGINGIHSHVPEQDADDINWNLPQAFPEKYIAPPKTKVICVSDDRGENHEDYAVGKKGVVQDRNILPDVLFKGRREPLVMRTTELAPINPEDHPHHPNFKAK